MLSPHPARRLPKGLLSALALGIALLALPSPAEASERKLERRASRLADTLDELAYSESSRIPPAIMQRAQGIIILRQYEAGFLFGAKGGFGAALARDRRGNWGPPAWLKTGEGSWGLQIGVQRLNVVFLLMNENGMALLDKPKFRIGVDAAAVAGPRGTNIEAKLGLDAPILVYAATEGLFAGAAFEAGFLFPANKRNARSYGKYLTPAEIVAGKRVGRPDWAAPLYRSLERMEKP